MQYIPFFYIFQEIIKEGRRESSKENDRAPFAVDYRNIITFTLLLQM